MPAPRAWQLPGAGWGWTEREMEDTREKLNRLSKRRDDIWYLIGQPNTRADSASIPEVRGGGEAGPNGNGDGHGPRGGLPEPELSPLDVRVSEEIARCIDIASGGLWALRKAALDRGEIIVELHTGGGELRLDAREAVTGTRCYKQVAGLAWSYRSLAAGGSSLPRETLAVLDRVIEGTSSIATDLRGALGG